MMKLLLAIILTVLTSYSYSCSETDPGFFPEGSVKLPKNIKAISQVDVEKVYSRLNTLYSKIVREKGGELQFEFLEGDLNVNAYAQKVQNNWYVRATEGIAKHPLINEEAFVLVMCHELGHHLAGAPLKRNTDLMSSEGQSDYFAAKNCFKKYYQDLPFQIVESELKTESAKCQEAFDKGTMGHKLCLKTIRAGYPLAKLLNKGVDVFINTPDINIVTETFVQHPKGQCRFDTFLAGATCSKNDEHDNNDPNVGTCNKFDLDEFGRRPLCWYRPYSI